MSKIPAEGLEIPILSEDKAVEALLQMSECTNRPDTALKAAQIVRKLGMLPLAIDQAAAFIRMSSLDTFLDVLHSNISCFLREPPGGNHPYGKSIFATWSLSLERLTANASQLAEAFAFLNPHGVLVEFLVSACWD